MSAEAMDERVLPLAGIHNFRDYGGYAIAGGGRLRRGLLFRSAQHRDATAGDLAAVAGLGLRTVIDLRGASEGADAPCPRPTGFDALVIRADEETSGLAPHLRAAQLADSPATARQAMLRSYAGMPFRRVLSGIIARYLAALAERDGPSLVHCMAGKDRTGFAVALVHRLLGVHADDIDADFLLTNMAGNPEARIAAGAATVRQRYGMTMDDATVRVIMSVEPEYLAAAWAAIDERHGGLDGYLRDVLGLTAASRDAMAARLIA